MVAGRYSTKAFKGQRLMNCEGKHGGRWSRHCLHQFFYIYFLKLFDDFRPNGCIEPHYVLDSVLGFCRNLATLVWINY